ncbi:MAG: M15 family metallopeptidase, partial [Anaerovoracaceae bacterium]
KKILLMITICTMLITLLACSSTSEEDKNIEVPKSDTTKTEFNITGMPSLYNYENFMSQDYVPKLGNVGNKQQMEELAAEAFLAMYGAAEKDGIILTPMSGYRTHKKQRSNFAKYFEENLAAGMLPEAALDETLKLNAIPGSSEHEAGLAMDIVTEDDPKFEGTPEFNWLEENAANYGFILRYAAEKKPITHIDYEPWHYRFVGTNHAKKIKKEELSLEEYLE